MPKLLPLLLLLLPAFARADYRLIVCASPTLPGAELWVKLNGVRGIVAVSEDAWFESEGPGEFRKLSQPLALGVYLKDRAARDPERGFLLELETAEETYRVRVARDGNRGSFEILPRDGGPEQLFELSCRPDQVPSPH